MNPKTTARQAPAWHAEHTTATGGCLATGDRRMDEQDSPRIGGFAIVRKHSFVARSGRFAACLIVTALAGCGGSSARSTATSTTASEASALEVQVAATGARQYDATGDATVKSVTCSPAQGGAYTCRMLYDFTDPNGERTELATTVPGSCSQGRCTPDWSQVAKAHVLRTLGMDPNSPVAKCEKALKISITQDFTDTTAGDQLLAGPCKYVRHGIYTPPGS